MRNALVGDTMPTDRVMGAMGLVRTTQDSARIAGALAGAGLFAALGFGFAYVAVTAFYLASLALTLGVSRVRPAPRDGAATSPWRELADGMVYVWTQPRLQALMWLAFLVNLTAYPVSQSLLPYVAKSIYQVDQTGLSYLMAAYAVGALSGSLVMTVRGAGNPLRTMLIGIVAWFTILLGFAHVEAAATGIVVLVTIGVAQSFGMVAMSVALLHAVSAPFRGRVMGVRMLAVYGMAPGLLAAGVLIEAVGFPATVTLYCVIGLVFTVLIAAHWHAQLWRTSPQPAE
jgi:predicted MFS family arabinose efflux permease